MASPTKGIAAGNTNSFLWFYGSDGLPTGGTPDAPAAGDVNGSPALRLTGVKEVPVTTPEPDEEIITGDDVRLGSFEFDSIATRRYIATLAVFNLQLDAYLLGTTVETLGDMKIGVMDIVDRVERTCGLIHQSRAKSQDAGGEKGQGKWTGEFVPLATVIPLSRQTFTERAGAVYRLSISPQVADHRPWGVTLADVATSVGATLMPFSSEYPIYIHVWTGDGIVTSWTTQHRPISVTKTPVFWDRVQRTVNSVTPATKAVVTSAAARAGARVIAIPQFDRYVE